MEHDMKPEETVRNYWRAWSDHSLDRLLALLAPAFVPRSSISQGRPANKDRIAMGFKMFDEALPDLKEEIISVVAEGDNVACQVIETATFTDPWSCRL
jgi:ketosteroid isomerase-like protein